MKTFIFTLAAICSISLMFGQTTTENYVKNTTYRTETTSGNVNDNQKIESVTYFDGLGRAIQSIGIRAGGGTEDVITCITYDTYSRQNKDYLPYTATTNGGQYRTDGLVATNSYYDASKYEPDFPSVPVNDINAYSQKEFEASPLNRVLKQAAPGKDWKLGNGHEIEFDYQSNSGSEVRHYSVNITETTSNNIKVYTPALITSSSDNGYYPAGELYKTITKDENHDGTSSKLHTTEEFKDKQGRVILKRTYALVSSVETQHDTYYIYDDYGNLSYVLPPKVVHDSSISGTELSELCYQYRYDYRNRLVEKKIPGKGDTNTWEEIVYNKLDQPALTRDPNLKLQGKWLVTKYDAFGRVAFTGVMNNTSTRTSLQNSANTNPAYTECVLKTSTPQTVAGTTIYYTNTPIPYSVAEIHTINYYDNYTFDKVSGNSETAYGVTPETNVKGLATGSKVRVLGTNDWITTVTYYDTKSRPIYVYSFNDYLNTTDKVKSEIGFTGQILKTTTTHAKTGHSTITTVDTFTYDHSGRLLTQNQQINSMPEQTIVQNNYDDLGQLISKGVGGKTTEGRLQNVNYTYNVRGWLKQINDISNLGNDLFSFKINYNTQDHGGTLLFNGNIAETMWKTKSDNILRRYRYEYDALNRLTDGIFNIGSQDQPHRYSVSNIAYDKNGNIEYLERHGHTNIDGNGIVTLYGLMDKLDYEYFPNTNQLRSVDELSGGNTTYGFKDGSTAAQEYWYDDNGNMLQDSNKGISSNITYNHLNLPTNVSLSGGNISYIYDATGVKLKKVVSTGGTTEYAGNYVYQNGSLKFFNHPEGYVDTENGYDYVYQYKDHLGNVRLSYQDTNGNYEEIIDSDFESSFDGWEENGSVNYSLDNGRLKANVMTPWEGVRYPLSGVTTIAGETLTVKVNFDKGNTQSNVRLYLPEYNSSGTVVRWNVVNWNLQTGYSEYTLTMVESGNSIGYVRIDKDNTNTSSETYFYIDHVALVHNDLEILEENNYYPFGLKHKGYNTVVNSTNPAQKFKYNGKELEESLGYEMYEYEARHYDATIGRFVTVDPLAEDYSFQSPYAYAVNSPIRFIDKLGMGANDVIITGNEKQNAFDDLQVAVKSELNLSMDSNGKVTYTQTTKGKLSADAQQLADAIDDNSIVVNVKAEDTKTTSTGKQLIGGSFMGNTVSTDASGNTTVQANQEINPKVLKQIADLNGKPGQATLHEVTEAYQGAKISKASGVSSPSSDLPSSVYPKAHQAAVKQPGTVSQRHLGASKQKRVMHLYPKGVSLGTNTWEVPIGTVETQYFTKGKIIQTFP